MNLKNTYMILRLMCKVCIESDKLEFIKNREKAIV